MNKCPLKTVLGTKVDNYRMANMTALGQASIPAVNQYLQLAKIQQLNITALLAQLSLTEKRLADHDKSISGEKFQQLIAGLLALSNDDLFGLHTAQYVQPGSYSVLGYIVMNCDTFGEALSKIQPFEKLVGDMGTTTLTPLNNYFKIGWHCIFPNLLVRRHMIDNCLASWLTFARYLTDNQGSAVRVLLSRTTPSLAQQAQYQKIFNCQLLYEQKSDEIVFEKSLLAMPLNKGNKQVLSTLEQHASSILSQLNDSTSLMATTKQLISRYLASGDVSQKFIAEHLKISTKTLQRRLKTEQTHFKALLDNIRLDLAKQLLQDNHLTIGYVSQQLGFVETRSFFRWFQQQTQQTPGQYCKHNAHKDRLLAHNDDKQTKN